MPCKIFALSIFILALSIHGTETSISRYARTEHGVLAKEYDMEGGRAYWIRGVSILGLPDAGADVMGFSEPAKRLPLGFSGLYAPQPVYERYGLSLNASNGNLVIKENYNPIDTPITKILWERYGLEGNAFTLHFNRQLLDSVVFTLGLASHSVPKSDYFVYQEVIPQFYIGTMKRDSSRVPFTGRNLAYNSFHFVPAITWLFPNSSVTVQTSFLFMDNDDATRDLFTRNNTAASIEFPQQPYKINGSASFYRMLWNYRFLPGWEISLSHRLADQEISGKYTAQSGESRISHKSFLNPYINVRYEYLRNRDSISLYQDRQLVFLGINDTLWRFAFRGQSGVQRNASVLDSVDFVPALHLGLTLFLPRRLQWSGDYQKDTRFPDMQETHISRVGRLSYPNRDLKAEKRQRWETDLTYKLNDYFFYSLGFRYEESKNAIMPNWAVSDRETLNSLPADSAFILTNNELLIFNNELFWRLGLELGNWRFYAEQGKSVLRSKTVNIPSRYYKGAVYWSNRFVEDRLKVSVLFDADWFGNRWDYGLRDRLTATPIQLKKYLSLNFKSSMQIQSFILYARIENMNHSLMEPEAGYAPPGIRFAYGIEWILGD